jgi:Tol biopolymer transport system component
LRSKKFVVYRFAGFLAVFIAALTGLAVAIGCVLPGGTIAYVSSPGHPNLYLIDINSRFMWQLTQNDDHILTGWAFWSPDDMQVIYDLCLYLGCGYVTKSLHRDDAQSVETAVCPTGINPCPLGYPALEDGRMVIAAPYSMSSDGVEIVIENADWSGRQRLTTDDTADLLPTLSPDKRHIAFASQRDGNWEIYAMNIDGTDPQRLTMDPATDYFPAWSPDGSHIAFASQRDGNWELYVMDSDGSHLRRLTWNTWDDFFPVWEP